MRSGTAGRTRRGRTGVITRGRGNGPSMAAGRRYRGDNVVGRAVRRAPLTSRPIVVNNYNYGRRGYNRPRGVYSYRPYYGRHRHGVPRLYGDYFYFPGYSTFNIGVSMGAGYAYTPYWDGYYGHSYGYAPYAYSDYTRDYYTGSLRLKVKPRFAEVLVDGYYVGLVNDFDGIFQRLRLEEGPHQIEVNEPGFEPLSFEVLILPGETITYEGQLLRLP